MKPLLGEEVKALFSVPGASLTRLLGMAWNGFLGMAKRFVYIIGFRPPFFFFFWIDSCLSFTNFVVHITVVWKNKMDYYYPCYIHT